MKKSHNRTGAVLGRLMLLMLLVLTLGVGTVAAKYIAQKGGWGLFYAPEFYFTSNYLMPEGAKYTLHTDVTEIDFTIGNNADELRISEVPIDYTITVTDNDGNDAQSATLSVASDNLAVQSAPTIHTVKLSNMKPGVTYTVTATGKGGYTQTLTAEFTIASDDVGVFKHLDVTDEYVVLTVWTHNLSGTMSVTVPGGLIPDNTDPALSGVMNYSEGAYGSTAFEAADFPKYTSQTYRFFRTGGSYTANSFTVKIGDNIALDTEPT